MPLRVAVLLVLLFTGAARCAEQSPFLLNMPQNSEQRCVGICGVAEALLEGKRQDAKLTNIDDLAETVYEHFTTGDPIDYPVRVMLKGKGAAIDSPGSLTALSNRVAELYKADFQRLSKTPLGVRQLLEAEKQVVKNREELEGVLKAESDKTAFFCCFGQRTFPDRTVKDTNHAALIKMTPDGKYVVFDPNDPRAPISCKLEDSDTGLIATWQCRYRDQDVMTKQSYLLVPQQRYFKVLRAPIPGQYSLIRQSRPGPLSPPAKCDCEK